MFHLWISFLRPMTNAQSVHSSCSIFYALALYVLGTLFGSRVWTPECCTFCADRRRLGRFVNQSRLQFARWTAEIMEMKREMSVFRSRDERVGRKARHERAAGVAGSPKWTRTERILVSEKDSSWAYNFGFTNPFVLFISIVKSFLNDE